MSEAKRGCDVATEKLRQRADAKMNGGKWLYRQADAELDRKVVARLCALQGTAAARRITELEDALRFYGRDGSYEQPISIKGCGCRSYEPSPVMSDKGRRAREVLAKAEPPPTT